MILQRTRSHPKKLRHNVAWYEKYRVIDKDIIDNANNLWKKIRKKKQPGIN